MKARKKLSPTHHQAIARQAQKLQDQLFKLVAKVEGKGS